MIKFIVELLDNRRHKGKVIVYNHKVININQEITCYKGLIIDE